MEGPTGTLGVLLQQLGRERFEQNEFCLECLECPRTVTERFSCDRWSLCNPFRGVFFPYCSCVCIWTGVWIVFPCPKNLGTEVCLWLALVGPSEADRHRTRRSPVRLRCFSSWMDPRGIRSQVLRSWLCARGDPRHFHHRWNARLISCSFLESPLSFTCILPFPSSDGSTRHHRVFQSTPVPIDASIARRRQCAVVHPILPLSKCAGVEELEAPPHPLRSVHNGVSPDPLAPLS